jgi:hypothetical protein
MAERSYIVKSSGQGKLVTDLKRYLTIEVTVSTDDTITVDEFASVDGAKALALNDGAAIASTVATNVITITEACTNRKVVILVVGS